MSEVRLSRIYFGKRRSNLVAYHAMMHIDEIASSHPARSPALLLAMTISPFLKKHVIAMSEVSVSRIYFGNEATSSLTRKP